MESLTWRGSECPVTKICITREHLRRKDKRGKRACRRRTRHLHLTAEESIIRLEHMSSVDMKNKREFKTQSRAQIKAVVAEIAGQFGSDRALLVISLGIDPQPTKSLYPASSRMRAACRQQVWPWKGLVSLK